MGLYDVLDRRQIPLLRSFALIRACDVDGRGNMLQAEVVKGLGSLGFSKQSASKMINLAITAGWITRVPINASSSRLFFVGWERLLKRYRAG